MVLVYSEANPVGLVRSSHRRAAFSEQSETDKNHGAPPNIGSYGVDQQSLGSARIPSKAIDFQAIYTVEHLRATAKSTQRLTIRTLEKDPSRQGKPVTVRAQELVGPNACS